ncbi:hypothetical protein ACXYMU_12370 [Pontibacter sp. CAU 1760]
MQPNLFNSIIRHSLTLVLLLANYTAFSQAKIEWAANYRISAPDFEAQPPKSREDVTQSFLLAGSLDYGYAMTNYEFMLTKNFNKHVTAYFTPANSWMQTGEQTDFLLRYAQMEFDLLELYARKLRKRLYESKNALSNYDFFQQAYDEVIAEMGKKQVEMQDAALASEASMTAYHQQIRKDIVELPDYCKACKPVKTKK